MKLLVAEDDRKLALFVQRVLSEAGFVVDCCSDGTGTLRRLELEEYDLLVLDWSLPGVDGLEISRELRHNGRRIPILMISGRDRVEQRVLALDQGADDYLVKPFKMIELVARVQALLRRGSGQRGGVFGELEIDYVKHSARIGGQPLDMTGRELALLMHLAHRRDEVLGRGQLLTQVWSTGFEPESNIVDVHMSRLRRKLGQHAWMIETVRGRGYRLRTKR